MGQYDGSFPKFYLCRLRKIILLSTYIELKNPFLLAINLVLRFVGQKVNFNLNL
jgi:hypothetical protein